MYLDIGNNRLIAERNIVGIFDLEITSQSHRTRAFLRRAQENNEVSDDCENLPRSFLVCTYPYHPKLVCLSELRTGTLAGRIEAYAARKPLGETE